MFESNYIVTIVGTIVRFYVFVFLSYSDCKLSNSRKFIIQSFHKNTFGQVHLSYQRAAKAEASMSMRGLARAVTARIPEAWK